MGTTSFNPSALKLGRVWAQMTSLRFYCQGSYPTRQTTSTPENIQIKPSTDQMSPDEDLRGRIIGPSTGPAVKHSTDPNPEPTQIEPTTTEFDLDGESASQVIMRNRKSKRSPDQIFSGSLVSPNPKHFKPFGCPVYVLDPALQARRPYHKWKERARVGINLGRSPRHPRNVTLVLSLTTGLVSPQYHVQYDNSFSTVKDNSPSSQWQYRAGFVTQRGKTDDAASASTNTGFAKRAPPVGEEKEQPIQGRHKRARFGDSSPPQMIITEKTLVVSN
jgi:hypothetical protein